MLLRKSGWFLFQYSVRAAGMVVHAIIQEARSPRQENGEFEVSLGCMRTCIKTAEQKKKQNNKSEQKSWLEACTETARQKSFQP